MDLKQVEYLENLVRIKLTPRERKLYAKQLGTILEYVEKLQEVDVQKIQSTGHATELKSVWREDAAIDCPAEEKKRILDNAPEKSGDFFKVKSVFE